MTRRQFLIRTALTISGTAIILPRPRHAYGAHIVAANASLSAVQAAVNAAANGDRVLIPSGSATWTSGIKTSKQIIIQAQSYAPTPGGTGNRSVSIVNNSGTPLFEFTSGNDFHCGLGGIRFNEGTGDVNHLRLNGSGSKVPLIYDCYFEVKQRFGNQPDIATVAVLSQGGVFWNCMSVGVGGGHGGQCCPEGASILINSPRPWTTASTLGNLDTNGLVNVYFEDSTIFNHGQSPDVDDRGRVVFRHCLLDGASGVTHGFTSALGGRHFEYYNNTFDTTTDLRNIAGRYFWARAGHGIIADCVVNNPYRGYGAPILLDSIVEGGGAYPKDRQVGWGHNGTSHIIDPIYIWNNSGSGAYMWSTSSPTHIQLNREIFVNSGAKPGYAKFSYPHPLRSIVDSGAGGGPGAPSAPTGLTVR